MEHWGAAPLFAVPSLFRIGRSAEQQPGDEERTESYLLQAFKASHADAN
jgi:hypothetical protein